MSAKLYVPLFLALCLTAGARDLQQAQAPAASASKPVADLLFILSAGMATFTDATTLTLSRVAETAQFYGSGARAGIIPTDVFANGTAGASYVASDGYWLNNPSATLFGMAQNNTQRSVVLTLSSPQADSQAQTVTFKVAVVSSGDASLKTSKGVANEVIAESATQAGYLQTAVQPGTVLTNAALFVDSNREELKPIAQTKTFWWWGPHWGWGDGWGGCGWGCGGWGR